MIAIAAVVAVGFIVVILIYNGLIGKKNQVENAFAGMDVQLKKRYDLIPNLVESVKTYMSHEKGTLEEITRLRTQAVSGAGMGTDERVALDNKITTALKGIMIQVENYPELKANDGFNNLQKNLTEVESQISASRRAYNAAVTDFNNAIEMIPGSLFAGPMNLSRKSLFEIVEAERENVNVGKLFGN